MVKKTYTRKKFIKTVTAGSIGAVGMGIYAPQKKSENVYNSYDLIIYGGTPSGIMAAVAAAGKGATVLIVESRKFLGGAVTGGLAKTDTGKTSTIGGLTRKFFKKASKPYSGEYMWNAEPKENLRAFNEMIEEADVEVVYQETLNKVIKKGNSIIGFTTLSGNKYSADVFIDATYEGDLVAKSDISYIVGREATGEYGEMFAGVLYDFDRHLSPLIMTQGCPDVGDNGPHFVHGTPTKISGLDQNENLIAGVTRSSAKQGSRDYLTQAYNFRLTVTQKKDNMLPWPKPERYNPNDYELLYRLIKAYPGIPFSRLVHLGSIAKDKYDLNAQGLFSTDYVGGNTDYPDGDFATRDRVWQDHIDYTKGFFWFLSQDKRVPRKLREEVKSWGMCKDEYTDNNNWPYQLYIREARRMVGEYIMEQWDVLENILKKDSIAMGSFIIDFHIVQRVIQPNGTVLAEGAWDGLSRPYQIPYRSIIPKEKECNNLLVPICMSASHVAYGSIRMEPVYMQMGHAAGNAAIQAMEQDAGVQHIDTHKLQKQLKKENQILSL